MQRLPSTARTSSQWNAVKVERLTLLVQQTPNATMPP
jgi:hypothetical protein